MVRPLTVIATSLSTQTRRQLANQLEALAFVDCLGITEELAQAHALATQLPPDVLLVDLTNRELDAGLFIQTMSTDHQQPAVLFALHEAMDSTMLLQCARQGAKEFIAYPADPSELDAALQRLQQFVAKVHSQAGRDAAANSYTSEKAIEGESGLQIYTVFGAKGGSGTTTVAIHLATELKRLSKKPVLLLDMDQSFCNTATLLNVKPATCLMELCSELDTLSEPRMLASLVTQHESGLHLLTATRYGPTVGEPIHPHLLDLLLSFMQDTYHYVVVDLPTHLVDGYHEFWMEQAHLALLLSCMDVPSMVRTRQYMEMVQPFLNQDKLKLVLNRWTLKSVYGMSNQSLEEEFHYPVFARLANDWDLNVEAASMGKLFRQLRPQAELTQQLEALARQLMLISHPQLASQLQASALLGRAVDPVQRDVKGVQAWLNKVLRPGGKTSGDKPGKQPPVRPGPARLTSSEGQPHHHPQNQQEEEAPRHVVR